MKKLIKVIVCILIMCIWAMMLKASLNTVRKKDLEVIIAHNNYKELINGVYIKRNRKHENTGFRFVIAGNKYAYRYNYSEKGWADCVTKIKSIILS